MVKDNRTLQWKGTMTERGALNHSRMPWSPEGDATAERAIGDLDEFLIGALEGSPVENLFVALGALAGHAAAQAAWERVAREGLRLTETSTKDGRRFYFSDAINAYLVPGLGSTTSVWALVAGGAVAAGLPKSDLPRYDRIFTRAALTLGEPNFGIIQLEGHEAAMQPLQALHQLWPTALQILDRPAEPSAVAPVQPPAAAITPPAGESGGFSVGKALRGMFGRKAPIEPAPAKITGFTKQHWPIAFGIVAHQNLRLTKDVLDPRIAVELFMEAAAVMSKLHPNEIPQTR
jgi:hypothetical protein